ncbi:hypothetical protein I6A84_19540 [Frankia sp. CNm7]|uniref:HEAT repeat domain-containing protein n=1 Tax=Frankia nepalensis TaxID=1836974 RepID=A0A937RC57_9ACTN|nr:hypothetical protein [Frankia nepalensis]MBL7496589.1 hypothetical protein [Frankia nepalensis]MBL7508808.1 hypothetical protein [Frankia nepalensis]MBL7520222.1 hypothetical protein [Frankia nepalensis]MBL7627562.1 hypothetical protein [Frankia nepalensis]
MINVEPWEELAEAENTYFAIRMRMFAAGAETQLRKALATPRGRRTALRVLLEAPAELRMDLIEPVFEATLGSTAEVATARAVLRLVDPGWLTMALRPLLLQRFSDSREPIDWSEYRRAAELLGELGQPALLGLLLSLGSETDDPDVREVVDDFWNVAEHQPDGRP